MSERASVAYWRRLALVLGLVAVAAGGLAAWSLWRLGRLRQASPIAAAPAAVEPDRIVLEAVELADLPGWEEDLLAEALPALRRSCEVVNGWTDADTDNGDTFGAALRLEHWQGICVRLGELGPGDEEPLRALIASELRPYAVSNRGEPEGLFTGYYEPTLAGSRRPTERYRFPLYRRPPELVTVNLGDFREDLRGRRLAGRVEDGALSPYLDRFEIEAGGLADRELELAWVDDPYDAFFLHVQGSGRVELEEGGFLRVGYAGQNGHPYFAIGRALVDSGVMTLEEVSLQSIRAWLEANPEEAPEVLAQNPSFVFFRELEEEGPVGSLGVVLTPERSLAVDSTFVPLGLPVWVDTAAPAGDPDAPDRAFRRLMVAQDTGGAIRGPVRGDIFWGPGQIAAHISGHMKHPGRLWLLLPRTAEETEYRQEDRQNGEPEI
ncbi:MAG: murein transglycosylase [Acidobacteria bacterium]|nr:MAG: murein transglycosylase [Acidobacteriota bacterium]